MNTVLIGEEVRPLRIKTVAEWSGVSDKTVRRWIRHGKLPSVKMGGLRVIRHQDFEAFWENLNQSEAKNVQTGLQAKGQ